MPYDPRKERVILMVPREYRRRALDVGCGECLYHRFFDDYYGIDENPRCPEGIKTIMADFHYFPFPSFYFTVVLLFDVLEHTTYYGMLLDEAYRVLVHGGYVIGSTIWTTGPAVHTDKQHVHCYTEELLRRALERHGFTRVRVWRDIDILYFIGVKP